MALLSAVEYDETHVAALEELLGPSPSTSTSTSTPPNFFPLVTGALPYNDRGFLFQDVPAPLQNLLYFKGSCSAKMTHTITMPEGVKAAYLLVPADPWEAAAPTGWLRYSDPVPTIVDPQGTVVLHTFNVYYWFYPSAGSTVQPVCVSDKCVSGILLVKMDDTTPTSTLRDLLSNMKLALERDI